MLSWPSSQRIRYEAMDRRAALPQRHPRGVDGWLTRTPPRRACRLQRPCSPLSVRANEPVRRADPDQTPRIAARKPSGSTHQRLALQASAYALPVTANACTRSRCRLARSVLLQAWRSGRRARSTTVLLKPGSTGDSCVRRFKLTHYRISWPPRKTRRLRPTFDRFQTGPLQKFPATRSVRASTEPGGSRADRCR